MRPADRAVYSGRVKRSRRPGVGPVFLSRAPCASAGKRKRPAKDAPSSGFLAWFAVQSPEAGVLETTLAFENSYLFPFSIDSIVLDLEF